MVARSNIASTGRRGLLERRFPALWRRLVSMNLRAGRTLSQTADSIAWLFRGWRRLLGRATRALALRTRIDRARSIARDSVRFLREPSSLASLDAGAIDSIASLGVRALIIGAIASFCVGWITEGAAGLALARAGGMLAWALTRLGILVILASTHREQRIIVAAAWAVSLLPFALGVTEGIRVLSLGASAWLCLGALEALGESQRRARTMVLWAFGGQAAVIAFGWVVLGGVAAIASLI